MAHQSNEAEPYLGSKAEFSQIYDLYFAKALIHDFTRVMKPSFYQNSKAEFSQVYEPLVC